jgi:ArsR family transcriptional regulator, arsenate/arsenite/antimonite-responsive transcriptional repressor
MEQADVVRSLAALAQPVRLQVFRALVARGPDGLTPGAMCEGLGIPANTLSFHLKELAQAGLVTQERSSRHIIYRAAFEHMDALLGYLTENCCRGGTCELMPGGRQRRS